MRGLQQSIARTSIQLIELCRGIFAELGDSLHKDREPRFPPSGGTVYLHYIVYL